MTTFILATAVILLCALCLGIGYLLKSKNPLGCKRCGSPEKKECSICDKKDQSGERK